MIEKDKIEELSGVYEADDKLIRKFVD